MAAGNAATEAVAAQMGMQVMHWEEMGVMDIFAAPSEDAAREMLVALLKREPSLVDPVHPSRDNVGAALYHWAVIHRGVFKNENAAAVAEYLLEKHPENVRDVCYMQAPGSLGLFDGETALHLSVAFSDMDLVQRLLDAGADPSSRAYGAFFAPSSSCYFGEYPLSFAVACGDQAIAEVLIAGGRNELLLQRDSFGNTALHIATIHRRHDLIDWLLEEIEAKLGVSKLDALGMHGASGLTPLELASVFAHKDDGKTFDMILSRFTRVEWVFGRVTCASVPLEQIDSVQLNGGGLSATGTAGAPEHISALDVVFLRRVYELSTHAHLVGIVEAKWKQFGQRAFFLAMGLQVVRLVLLTWLATVYGRATRWLYARWEEDEYTVIQEYEGYPLLSLLEYVIFVDCVLNTAMVVLDLYAARKVHGRFSRCRAKVAEMVAPPPQLLAAPNGKALWRRLTDAVDFVNFAPSEWWSLGIDKKMPLSEYDMFAWVGQLFAIGHFITLKWVGYPTHWASFQLSTAGLLLWMSSLAFTAFSRRLGMLAAVVFRTIKHDVIPFLLLFFVFLLGFGTAIHVVRAEETSYARTLHTIGTVAFGDTANFNAWGHADAWLSPYAYVLHLWFAIVALVILLNLLISIFSCTFQQVQTKSEQEWRLAKGRCVLLLERRLRVLAPFLDDHLRVNHFDPSRAGLTQVARRPPAPEHRYVFMTEAPDVDPDKALNEQLVQIKDVVRDALAERQPRASRCFKLSPPSSPVRGIAFPPPEPSSGPPSCGLPREGSAGGADAAAALLPPLSPRSAPWRRRQHNTPNPPPQQHVVVEMAGAGGV
eukprot:TRINITY_DN3602_c0_g1_i2.p1 TRINITY_DN3602_c0_g1~~TRINITY_DN3602_c0_g1_i2.p1  ORF type:complete len:820 (+),score=272.17 TRINITY_DN3602_c0_g1_i2:75-2534(+)